jgi:biofilm PGA synthesis N-glycosyltransferase PgaC
MADPEVDMTGGRQVPVNDPRTFIGFAAHLLWGIHHHVCLQSPKLGELTAFRRVFRRIPGNSAVDEANMEPLIRGQGCQLSDVPEALVYNRGPGTVRDLLKQRARIYAGHLCVRHKYGYTIATMSPARIMIALLKCWRLEWPYFL